jgi:PRELI-like family
MSISILTSKFSPVYLLSLTLSLSLTVHRHNFSNITLSWYLKYAIPSEYSSHIIAVDTVDRAMNTDGSLTFRRIIVGSTSLPAFAKGFGIPDKLYAAEITTVDPKTKKLVVRSQNITGSSLMRISERCSYTPSKTNPEQTDYKQEAHVEANLGWLSGALESHSIADFQAKSSRGLQLVENICGALVKQGLDALFSAIRTSPASV